MGDDGLYAVRAVRTFPGRDEHCPGVRRFIRRALTGHPDIADDAELITAELFANACRHSVSGDPGGWVQVSLVVLVCGLARLEVVDEGRSETVPAVTAPTDESPNGRGILLVQALAQRWGRLDPNSDLPYIAPAITWAELTTAPTRTTMTPTTSTESDPAAAQ